MTSERYSFTNHTERRFTADLDLADFTENPELGKGVDVTILVKWTNQTYHDENLRAIFSPEWDNLTGISRTNAWRHRNQYYPGKIVEISLDNDYLDDASAAKAEDASQPTGIDRRHDGTYALALGDRIHLSDTAMPSDTVSSIERVDFARLHSVEFDDTGRHILTTSSSLDLIQEVDLTGNLHWTWDMWDTTFNTNQLNQSFYRSIGRLVLGDYLHNPSVESLKDPSNHSANVVIDDPNAYDRLGLSTNLTPVFPNGASYGFGRDILVSSFHRGESWILNKESDSVKIVTRDQKKPHGFHRDPSFGYIVSDTGNEVVHFISPDLESETRITTANLQGRKPGLEAVRWLQYTTRLADNLYCAVIAPRQMITLFDPIGKTRRDIPFDPEWGIQKVVPTHPVS